MATKPIYKTITNEEIANFATEYPADLKGFTVEIAETLYGVSEVNVTACGKNLFNKADYTYINAYMQLGTVTTNSGHTLIYMPCKPNTDYTVSRERTIANERLAVAWSKVIPENGTTVYDIDRAPDNGTVGDTMSVSVETGEDALYLCIWAWWSSSDSTKALNTMQIEVGSAATDYAAYSAVTRTIDLDTTVYEGSVTVDTDGNCIYSDGEDTTELDPIDPIKTLAGVNNIWADTGDILTLTYLERYDFVIIEPVMDISSPLGALWEQAAGIDGSYPIGDYSLLVTKGGDCLATKNGELLQIKGGS